jgi:predicted ATPase/class 3 adenylate cyclase
VNQLPSGTVTFLFTDVEGSTRLLDALGSEAYAIALAEHRRVIREACTEHDGAEVDTQGDAFFFAFPTAPGALRAAHAFSDRLSAGPISVRVGLHTGTPHVTEEGYVGPDVHRAARIAASGHGGQVLVSAATAALVEMRPDGLPPLVDLGEHRFKDLSASERVYQLGDGEFAPLKSLYRTNLPVPATSFLGREEELAAVVQELRSPDVLLLTLTGPGGTGKTRLALQAAGAASDGFPDGVWWVPLAPLALARNLIPSLAQALGVEEGPGVDFAAAVTARLDGRRALLLLDNAEHLVPDVADEIAQLRDIAGPTILVTSRERLQLQGERVYAVPPLDQHDGVELFLSRASDLQTGGTKSEPVVELCARLDNLPLAVELAAARTVVFSPTQLLERLSERLDLLTAGRDADPRQQTLRATIEWSHDLLDDGEQALFRRFSVFAGGATYEAVEAVCGTTHETLQSLVDKSLLRRIVSEPPRFIMLETIRELAAEKLAAEGETDAVRRRHAEHFLLVAQRSGMAAEADGPQLHHLVIPERDNMRAALTWALESGERDFGLELVVSLENHWAIALPEEGLEWASTFLESGSERDSRVVARALRVQGGMQNLLQLEGSEESEESWTEALAILRRLGDDRGVATLLHRFSVTAMRRGDWPRVRELAEESLALHRGVGRFPKGEAQALGSLAAAMHAEGDPERALELLRESSELADSVGFRWWHSGMLATMAQIQLELGTLDEAKTSARKALAQSHAMHDRRGVVYELGLLAEIDASAGDARLAGVLIGATEAENERAPVGPWLHGSPKPSALLESVDPEFARGRDEGRRLELDAAIAVALGDA